jgi:hypothetical protein
MPEVIAIVEGQSEQAFVERVIAPHLGALGLAVHSKLIGPPGHKGGLARSWSSCNREIRAMLRIGGGKRVVHATTLFDFYGMRPDWPGRTEAMAAQAADQPRIVEQAIHAAVCTDLGSSFDPDLFFPHVQMHELEALLFTDIGMLRYEFLDGEHRLRELADSVRGIPPEEINDSPTTAPSKRIIRHVPEYSGAKVRAAPEVLNLIGLPALRKACPHFASWMTRLESLAPGTRNR